MTRLSTKESRAIRNRINKALPKKVMQTTELTIMLQWHDADRAEAMRLLRFMAEIEPAHRSDVRIVGVRRWDCEDADAETVTAVLGKFSRFSSVTSGYRMAGWPAGPNGMARASFEWARNNVQPESPILLIEPDCVPLCRDWINLLLKEWQNAGEALAVGSWRDSGGEHGHLNGNGLFRANLAAKVDFAQMPQGLAWDCWIAPFLRRHWYITGRILNKFQSRNATEKELSFPEVGTEPPCLVHGYKDDSAYQIARKWVLS